MPIVIDTIHFPLKWNVSVLFNLHFQNISFALIPRLSDRDGGGYNFWVCVHSYTDLKPFLVCHLSLATKQRVIFIIMKGRAATITRRIQACAANKKLVINFLKFQFHGNLNEQ